MTSANTLLKNILGVKGAVVQGADFSKDSYGVKKLTVRMRPRKRESDRCPICGRHCSVYDRSGVQRSWRSLDFAGILVYLKAYTQRISCPRHGVLVAAVPWAFHDSGFTKRFDLTATWMAEFRRNHF